MIKRQATQKSLKVRSWTAKNMPLKILITTWEIHFIQHSCHPTAAAARPALKSGPRILHIHIPLRGTSNAKWLWWQAQEQAWGFKVAQKGVEFLERITNSHGTEISVSNGPLGGSFMIFSWQYWIKLLRITLTLAPQCCQQVPQRRPGSLNDPKILPQSRSESSKNRGAQWAEAAESFKNLEHRRRRKFTWSAWMSLAVLTSGPKWPKYRILCWKSMQLWCRCNAGDEESSSDAWKIAEAPRNKLRFNDLRGLLGPFPSRLGSKCASMRFPRCLQKGVGWFWQKCFDLDWEWLRYDVVLVMLLCWSVPWIGVVLLPANTKASSFTSARWLCCGKKMSNVFDSAPGVRGCFWAAWSTWDKDVWFSHHIYIYIPFIKVEWW